MRRNKSGTVSYQYELYCNAASKLRELGMKVNSTCLKALVVCLFSLTLVPSIPGRVQASPVAFVPITITNSQATLTGVYQQQISIDSSSFSSLINADWSNVEFQYPNGTSIPAWVEFGNNNTSVDTRVWLRLNSISGHSSQQINMAFLPASDSILSSQGPTGEAPWLSPTFGEFDNGRMVFDLYANFQGSSLPSGWSLQGSAIFVGGTDSHGGVELVQSQNVVEGAVVDQNPMTEQNVMIEESALYYNTALSGEANDIGVGFYSQGPVSEPACCAAQWRPYSPAGYYASYSFYAGAGGGCAGPCVPAVLSGSNPIKTASSQTMPSAGMNYLFTRTVVASTSISMNFLTRTNAEYQAAPTISLQNVVSYFGPVSNGDSTLYIGGASGGVPYISSQNIYWIRVLKYLAIFPNYTIGQVQNYAGFSVTAPPTETITSGSAGTAPVTLKSMNGFAGDVTLASTVATSGLTVSANPSTVPLAANGTAVSTLTLTSSSPGTYDVTITAASGSLHNSTHMQVTVNNSVSPDFGITVNPAPIIVQAGGSTTSQVTVTSLNGFQGDVTLSAFTTGPSASLSPTSASATPSQPGTSVLTVTASLTTPPGSYSLTITGGSGLISHQPIVQIVVSQPPPSSADFSVAASPSSMSFDSGSSAGSTITLTPIQGFTGTVSLSVAPPAGVFCNLDRATVQSAGTATLTCNSSSPGDYSVNVTAQNGSTSHSATVVVHVSPLSRILPVPPATILGLDTTVFYVIIGVVIALIAVVGIIAVTRRKKR